MAARPGSRGARRPVNPCGPGRDRAQTLHRAGPGGGLSFGRGPMGLVVSPAVAPDARRAASIGTGRRRRCGPHHALCQECATRCAQDESFRAFSSGRRARLYRAALCGLVRTDAPHRGIRCRVLRAAFFQYALVDSHARTLGALERPGPCRLGSQALVRPGGGQA